MDEVGAEAAGDLLVIGSVEDQEVAQFAGFEGTGEVTRRGRAVIVTIASDVLFDSGKAVVKEKRGLEKIASVINSKYSGYKVRVRGHTDGRPAAGPRRRPGPALRRCDAERLAAGAG